MRRIGDKPMTAAERQRRYREAHPDRVRESLQRFRETHPGAQAAASKRHYQAHKEKANSRVRVRRASAKAFVILPKEMQRLLSQPCAECGSRERQSIDHIVPLSRGGQHSIGNLQTLCSPCNNSKFNRFIVEWRRAKTASLAAA